MIDIAQNDMDFFIDQMDKQNLIPKDLEKEWEILKDNAHTEDDLNETICSQENTINVQTVRIKELTEANTELQEKLEKIKGKIVNLLTVYNMFYPEKLTPDVHELLVLLIEECGEVIQAATKCIRDKDYVHQLTGKSHIEELKVEMSDLRIIMQELKLYDDYCPTSIEAQEMYNKKRDKLEHFTNVFKKDKK